MSTTTSTTRSQVNSGDEGQGHRADDVAACACHLYDAECALHAAHQSGVEEWITAAGEKLHQAVADYLAAVAARDETARP